MTKQQVRLFLSTFLIAFITFTSLGLQASSPTAVRAENTNSVTIDQLVLSRCGTQQAYASGTATFGSTADYLLIDIDGLHTFNLGQSTFWVTGLVELEPGSHTVTARIHNNDQTFTDTQTEVMVPTCPQPESNDGNEGDCCPGPDPEVKPLTPAKQPRVKAATTRNVNINSLSPLNSTFRLVFGRTPVFQEWQYWAERYLTDKPSWHAILGAMQWHHLQGQTTGL